MIKKKALVLQVEHHNDNIEIWGFVTNECAIIKSKDEVPFEFIRFPDKKVNAMIFLKKHGLPTQKPREEAKDSRSSSRYESVCSPFWTMVQALSSRVSFEDSKRKAQKAYKR